MTAATLEVPDTSSVRLGLEFHPAPCRFSKKSSVSNVPQPCYLPAGQSQRHAMTGSTAKFPSVGCFAYVSQHLRIRPPNGNEMHAASRITIPNHFHHLYYVESQQSMSLMSDLRVFDQLCTLIRVIDPQFMDYLHAICAAHDLACSRGD